MEQSDFKILVSLLYCELIIQLTIVQLQEIQKTQNMVLEFTNQGSVGHTTSRKERPREFKPLVKRRYDADRTETLVRNFNTGQLSANINCAALVARANE